MIAAVPLTARQTEVMDLVVDGWSDDEIGVRMGLSVQRVKQHLTEARAYYDAPNRTKAAVMHERERLIEEVYRTRLKPRRKPTPPRIAAGQSDLELA